MSDTPRDCEHGQLARSCEICELQRELAEARAENAALRNAFVYEHCWEFADDCPGVRGECSEKVKAGKPCKQCPLAWTREAIAARDARKGEKP